MSANTENDHTIRYEHKADILNDLIENFKHPLVHRGKKPYSTSTLYNTVRKAYIRKDTPFDVFETHTPVNDFTKHPDGSINPGYTPIFSTEHDTQRCVSSARPERHFDMASTFTAYRVSENVDVASLEGTDARFAIEKREVSYPVLQAQFDEDDDSLALRNIIPGESISIIGFVVDRNQTLDRTSVVHVGNDQKEIERLIDSGEQFVVLCPNQLANVLGILAPSPAEISRREEEKLRRCFNFESANAILSPYKLDIYSVDHVTITDIRSRITRNIIDLIDYVAATHSKYAKKLRAEFLEERRLNFFSNMPGLMTEALGSSLILTDTDDMEFLGRLKSIGGAEQLYCLAIGIQYRDELTDVEVELKSLIIRARVLTGETSEAASYSDMLEFVRNPEKALKKRNKQKCVKTLQRRIEFLEETSKILEKIAETGWQHVVDEAVSRVAFIDRRQKEGRSSKTLVADAKTIEDFSLSLNEESDENEGDSDAVSPAKYISEYSPNVLPSYFLSPELQSKLIADSSVRLQDHFTARPLLLIARQINTMLHPNKLSCHMSIQEIKAMVYDISEMCDESFSLFERRAFVQELMMSNGMERQEAFGEWKKLVGGELDVKTQKRVSVVLARLMLQLELQRPLHSFRKIFPIGGQKSIGKDSQSSFESYTPDNKVKYIVTVAAQTADLGKEGRLMTDYQASDLKNIYAYTTSYYDKFLRKPSLIAMKAVADKADQIQTTLLTEKTKTQIPHGYTLVQSEESMKPLLDRLEAYNVALQSLIHRLEIQGGDFAELIAVQRALRKKIYFLVVSSLASIQRQIDGTDESEWNEVSTSAYNPDKYGDEKSTACQPGEVCILTTFIDLAKIRSRVREELRESETVLKRLKTRLYFVRFPRRNTSPTYDFRRFNPTTLTNPTEVLRQRVRPGRPHERAKRAPDVSVLDNLVEILASKTGKDERWRIAFSAKLSDLGKCYTGHLSSGVGLGLLKQFYRSLRTDIQLLSSHLYVTVNSYEMVRDKDGGQTESRSGGSFHQPGDTMEIITARGTIYQMKKLARLESRIYVEEKRQEWDVLYYNREDNYLTKYLALARPLQGYTNAEDFASVVAISPDKSVESYENTHEAMLCSLTTELLNCCNHVLRQNPDAIEVANFSIDFLKRCFKRQDDVENQYGEATKHAGSIVREVSEGGQRTEQGKIRGIVDVSQSGYQRGVWGRCRRRRPIGMDHDHVGGR